MASALSPINKKGIKLATLVTEVGLGLCAYESWQNNRDDPAGMATGFITRLTKPQYNPAGAMVWTGVAIALIGRLTGFRGLGPIQLS